MQTDAGIEVHKYFGFYLRRSGIAAQMTLPQRAVNLLYAFRDYAPVMNILALMVLPLVLHPRQRSEPLDTLPVYHHQLAILRNLFLFTFITNKIYYFIAYNHIGMSRVWNFQSNEIWAAPCKYPTEQPFLPPTHRQLTNSSDMTYRCILSLLPPSINIPTFVVCGTIPANERSRAHRKPFLVRLASYDMLMFIAYIVYASLPFLALFYSGRGGGAGMPFPGAWVKLMSCVLKTTVPVRYMLWPPTVPERAKLMEEDERGVRVPRREWKEGGRGEWRAWAVVAALELGVLLWVVG